MQHGRLVCGAAGVVVSLEFVTEPGTGVPLHVDEFAWSTTVAWDVHGPVGRKQGRIEYEEMDAASHGCFGQDVKTALY